MRTSATLFVALLTAFTVAQSPGDTLTMYFDTLGEPLQLDSVYPAGCWQVGTPSKPVFTGAYSPGKALVTDTLLPHPTNTTCYAQFSMIANDQNYLGRSITWKQWLDTDSMDSYGCIEAYDPGVGAWVRTHLCDLWGDANSSFWTSTDEGTIFTGHSGGWFDVDLALTCGGRSMEEQHRSARAPFDTLKLRFVFVADSNTASADGWMIDDVRATATLCFGSVNDMSGPIPTMFPVPTNDLLTIDPELGAGMPFTVDMLLANGRTVLRSARSGGGQVQLDVSTIPSGVYVVRVTTDGSLRSGKCVVLH